MNVITDEMMAEANLNMERAIQRLSDTALRIKDEHQMMLAALKDAVDEFHHPGSCRYTRDVDIVDHLNSVIAKAEAP